MELLKTALLIAFLTTVSAMPRSFRRHHDADIPEQKMSDANHRFTGDAFIFEDSSESSESNSSSSEEESNSSSSEEESNSSSSEEESNSSSSQAENKASSSEEDSKSSEEITIPVVTVPAVTTPAATTPAATTPAVTSPAMTTVEDGSTATPEVGTLGTDQPIVMETTLAPETPAPSVDVTPTCDQCFTVVIPTAAPITDNRGDN